MDELNEAATKDADAPAPRLGTSHVLSNDLLGADSQNMPERAGEPSGDPSPTAEYVRAPRAADVGASHDEVSAQDLPDAETGLSPEPSSRETEVEWRESDGRGSSATSAPTPSADHGTRCDDERPRLIQQLTAMSDRIEEFSRLAQHQAGLVDRLHEENQRLRAGELVQAQAPLFRDLIRLHDDIVRLDDLRSDAGTECSDLSIVKEALLALLARAGVDVFAVPGGEPFDPDRHHGVTAIPSASESDHNLIVRTLRVGFTQASRVIRPAEVEVYRCP